jgi:hypothetical protein
MMIVNAPLYQLALGKSVKVLALNFMFLTKWIIL